MTTWIQGWAKVMLQGTMPPLILIAGCQAEEESALGKEATGEGSLSLGPGDTLIFSSRAVPGNEERVRNCIQDLQARGARIIVNAGEAERLGLTGVEEALVHASGHASLGDGELALQLLKPKYTIPRPPSLTIVKKLHQMAEGRTKVLYSSTVTLKEIGGALA